MRDDPPGVQLLNSAKLIRLEAGGVSNYFLDCSRPPVTVLVRTPHGDGSAFGHNRFGLKLQEE
jgi:hypothetical protein